MDTIKDHYTKETQILYTTLLLLGDSLTGLSIPHPSSIPYEPLWIHLRPLVFNPLYLLGLETAPRNVVLTRVEGNNYPC